MDALACSDKTLGFDVATMIASYPICFPFLLFFSFLGAKLLRPHKFRHQENPAQQAKASFKIY